MESCTCSVAMVQWGRATEFEREIAAHQNVRYVVATPSSTEANIIPEQIHE